MDDEIGTAKVAVFIQIVLNRLHPLLRIILWIIRAIEATQPQLSLSPITNYIVILTQNGTKTISKCLRIKSVFVVSNQRVRMIVDQKMLLILLQNPKNALPLHLATFNVFFNFTAIDISHSFLV